MGRDTAQTLALASAMLRHQPEEIEIEELENPFFNLWHFWKVVEPTYPPRLLRLATSDQLVLLLMFENGFQEVVQSEPCSIADEAEALSYLNFFLFVTRPLALIVSAAAEIPGLEEPLSAELESRLTPPKVSQNQESDWMIRCWIWESAVLTLYEFSLDATGLISSDWKEELLDIGLQIDLD